VKLRSRLLIFGYPLIEILLFWWVASLTGWGIAILLIIAGFPAGAALMRNAAAKASVVSTTPDAEKPKVARSAALMFVSGVLILLPGFATDVLGIIFLIPPIGNRIVQAFSTIIGARMVRMPGYGNAGFTGSQFASYVDGEVIRGVVISEDDPDEHENGGPFGPPQITS
jgi:UPF0716 protein FxsA